MGKLRYKINFVSPNERIWDGLRTAQHNLILPEKLAEICVDSLDCWVLRTAYELRNLGETVSVSSSPQPDAINVADIYATGIRNRGLSGFYLIPRADGHEPELANYTLLQNGVSTSSRPFAQVGHWIQPGIVPRGGARGETIATMAFKGALLNLDPAFRSEEFIAALKAEGVELQFGDSDKMGGSQWADYSGTDLLLAIRNMTFHDADGKPASKLVNAWWADVPALLGPEPAFAEVGRPGVDYVDIRSPNDVLKAIRSFRARPGSYTAMVEAGKESRAALTDAATAQRWIELLNGPIGQAFDTWNVRRSASKMLEVILMAFKERQSKRRHLDAVFNGPRLLDSNPEYVAASHA